MNNNNEDINTKIGIFSAFLKKSTSNNQNFELLKNCSDHIENELNSIRKFEKMISMKDNLKERLKLANDSRSEINFKKKELLELEDKVIDFENYYEEIIEKIRVNNEKEEILKGGEETKTDNKIKSRIKELKVKDLRIFHKFVKFTLINIKL